jgi:hypothetical protein
LAYVHFKMGPSPVAANLALTLVLSSFFISCRNEATEGSPIGSKIRSDRKASVTGVTPISAKPGDILILSGQDLDVEKSMLVTIGDLQATVEVSSATAAKFKMPDGAGLGLKRASVVGAAGEVGSFRLVADTAGNSLPIIIADVSQVCSDITYINASGDQVTGTRDCTGAATGSVDPYDIRKGKTVSGVSGKLNGRCQNTTNLSIHNMSGGANFRAARVKKITSDGKFILQQIASTVPLPEMINDTPVRILGNSHPILNGDSTRYTGRFRLSTQLIGLDAGSNLVYTPLDTAAGEIALKRDSNEFTEKFTATPQCDLDANPPVSTECFTIVEASGEAADVWDTIDDYNAGLAPGLPPDSGLQEAFNTGVCGYLDAPELTVPSHAIATWKDNTRTSAGLPSSCAVSPASCSILDLHSGLSWFKGISSAVSWLEAVSYCASVTVGGLGGWRLPTQKELMSAYINSISRVVSSGTVSNYNKLWWSSTTSSIDTAQAWGMNLSNGDVGLMTKITAPVGSAAMCVRGP